MAITKTRKSAKARLLAYLKTGYDISPVQASNRFNMNTEDVSKRIFELRQDGYPIYTNRTTNRFGEKVTRYRLGSAPRFLVAMAVRNYGTGFLQA